MPDDDSIEHFRVLAKARGTGQQTRINGDLMVLGGANFGDLARVLATAQDTLRRDVNPTVMPPKDFARQLAATAIDRNIADAAVASISATPTPTPASRSPPRP
jgi:hypothetical protein